MLALSDTFYQLINHLKEHKQMLVTAESCTGGLLASYLTTLPGSSLWFESGFITYSNDAKHRLLAVKKETLRCFGAVSEASVLEMAAGALQQSRAHYAIAITGIAGPDGGSEEKPVGTVFIGIASHHKPVYAIKYHFDNLSREHIRQMSCEEAIKSLWHYISQDVI